jgi:hypothetical protein
MSWDFVTRGPHVLTSRAMFRFLAASEKRSTEEGAGLAAEDFSTVDAGAVRPSPRASFSEANRVQDAPNLDAVAGSEFVDDRIRLQE